MLRSLGETVQLTAAVQDQNGQTMTGVTVTWASRDIAVATVNAAGLVTAVRNGVVIVQASVGTVVGTADVTVEQRPAEVRVSPAADTLVALGDTLRLSAEAFDANGHPVADVQLTWASGDESVATVDAGGLVMAAGNGTASVTASVEEAAGSAEVTVDQRPAEVRVSPGADTLVALGDTLRLSAEAFDTNGHTVGDAEFTWTSDDESVLTVDAAGLVTAVGRGGATVTATTGDVSGSAAVTVEQRPLEVRVSPGADTLAALGDTLRLSAEALDGNGNVVPDAEFTWASGDAAVAAVDSTGLVTAVSNGSAEVAASVAGTAGSTVVTVAQRAVDMRVSPAADTLLSGDTLRLSAEAEDANGHLLTNAGFIWSSGDESVAAVDANGLVTAMAAGSAEVAVAEATAGLTRTVLLLVVEVREELAEVHEALGGAGWANADNWGTDAPLDEWYGVTTDAEGRITGLDLSDNGLTGPIPPGLGLLESLEELDLSGNGITGEAVATYESPGPVREVFQPAGPEQWPVGRGRGSLSARRELASAGWFAYALQQQTEEEICAYRGPKAVGEGLTGSIPPALGALKRLKVLDLSYNSLTGSIPPELANIESLEVLDLGWNMLSGPIPPELGALANLEILALCVNGRWDGGAWVGGLTGSIPPELGDLANLQYLVLHGNDLTGSIPPELGDLANLQTLGLSYNDLTGSIPPELGDLANLQYYLVLHGNDLTGSIPPELGDLANLRYLGLDGNDLTGSIPPELGDLANLQYLGLSYNDLTGSIPPELGDLANLQTLDLNNNDLTGSIPPELGDLANLQYYLVLHGNDLTGSIPPELGDLANLRYLGLDGNDLTGSIPPELGDLANLQYLGLSYNDLTGSIPPELGDLANLQTLDLNNNDLTGSIPPELGDLANLRFLYLNNNDLTGWIPAELGRLRNLHLMWLHDSGLTGAIPREFIGLSLWSFHWHETDLCAPADQEFQDWLQSINNHMGGVNCSSGLGN